MSWGMGWLRIGSLAGSPDGREPKAGQVEVGNTQHLSCCLACAQDDGEGKPPSPSAHEVLGSGNHQPSKQEPCGVRHQRPASTTRSTLAAMTLADGALRNILSDAPETAWKPVSVGAGQRWSPGRPGSGTRYRRPGRRIRPASWRANCSPRLPDAPVITASWPRRSFIGRALHGAQSRSQCRLQSRQSADPDTPVCERVTGILPVTRRPFAECRSWPGYWPGVSLESASRRGIGVAPSWKLTGTLRPTIPARSSASQFVRRMHPCDCVLPTRSGSGVPWMP